MGKYLGVIFYFLISLSDFSNASANELPDEYFELKRKIQQLSAELAEKKSLYSESAKSWQKYWTPTRTKKILKELKNDQIELEAKIDTAYQDLERIKGEIEVQALVYRLGRFSKINLKLSEISGKIACENQRDFLMFANDETFLAWLEENDSDLEQEIKYYASKNPYISRCLDLNQGEKVVSVDYTSSHKCEGQSRVRGSEVSYSLEKENGAISLKTSIYLNYGGEEAKKEEAFQRIREAKECMRKFFARHGIRLDVEFKEDTGLLDAFKADHRIELRDRYGLPDSGVWVSHYTPAAPGFGDGQLTAENVCSLALHEFGHRLGLRDTYPGGRDCRNRPVGPENDLMHNHWRGPERIKIMPKAIQQILRPLCET
jgi:hypothetical protein